MIPALGGWGLLPIMAPVAAATILGLAALLLNRSAATTGERLLAGAVTWIAVVAAGVRILGAADALTTPVLAGSAVVVAMCVGVAVWVRAVPVPAPRRWRGCAALCAATCASIASHAGFSASRPGST